MSRPGSLSWATTAGPLRVQYLTSRRVLRLAAGEDVTTAVEIPLEEFFAGLGLDVAKPPPPWHYLLFADVGRGRDGTSRHVATAFRDEDSARGAFRALRLEHGDAADWAELTRVEASGELRRLCWFGTPWSPGGPAMGERSLDEPVSPPRVPARRSRLEWWRPRRASGASKMQEPLV